MQRISIIGIGRVGGALALALSRKGYLIETLVHRNPETAELIQAKIHSQPRLYALSDMLTQSLPLPVLTAHSDIIFITTADPEIQAVSEQLAAVVKGKPFVFHTSGSLSSAILSDLHDVGCKTGSIHPLVSISDAVLGAERLAGSYFCIEGDDDAMIKGKEIVEALGGIPFFVETAYKTLYHAAAVTASGHFTALVDVAIEMLSKCGIEADDAKKILLPLVKSTVKNLETQEPQDALTGTFARADIAAFEAHLQTLKENVDDEVLKIYLGLAERSLSLAEKRGDARDDRVHELRKRISIAKKKTE